MKVRKFDQMEVLSENESEEDEWSSEDGEGRKKGANSEGLTRT